MEPGSLQVPITGDSWIQEDNVSHTAGTDTVLDVKSQATKVRRALLQPGTLPTAPSGCSLASAVLQVYSTSAQSARTLEVIRASGAWAEATVNWTNRPGTAGTSSTAANGVGWIQFTVTTQVQAWYVGASNYGSYIKDQTEDANNFVQGLSSKEGSNLPVLVVTFN